MGELRSMLVARQVPSKLRHCGAKSARGAPTCNLSTAAGWGSRSSSPSLPVLGWNRTVTDSLAGTGTKGLVLGDCLLNGCFLQRTQSLKNQSSGLLGLFGGLGAVFFVLECAGSESLVFCMKVTHDSAMRSAWRMVRTLCWSTLGSGPRTWDP